MRTLIGIIIVALIGLGAWSMLRKPAETEMEKTNDESTMSAKLSPITDGNYVVDLSASNIAWKGSKPLITNYFDEGTIKIASGDLEVEEGEITTGSFDIDMNTISAEKTSNAGMTVNKLSTHLKSPDFFDVAKFATSTFEITNVSANPDATFTISGDLTIKGITNPVDLKANISEKDGVLTATAEGELDRSLWDIRYGSGKFFEDLGDKIISDTFNIQINLVANKTN